MSSITCTSSCWSQQRPDVLAGAVPSPFQQEQCYCFPKSWARPRTKAPKVAHGGHAGASLSSLSPGSCPTAPFGALLWCLVRMDWEMLDGSIGPINSLQMLTITWDIWFFFSFLSLPEACGLAMWFKVWDLWSLSWAWFGRTSCVSGEEWLSPPWGELVPSMVMVSSHHPCWVTNSCLECPCLKDLREWVWQETTYIVESSIDIWLSWTS